MCDKEMMMMRQKKKKKKWKSKNLFGFILVSAVVRRILTLAQSPALGFASVIKSQSSEDS